MDSPSTNTRSKPCGRSGLGAARPAKMAALGDASNRPLTVGPIVAGKRKAEQDDGGPKKMTAAERRTAATQKKKDIEEGKQAALLVRQQERAEADAR